MRVKIQERVPYAQSLRWTLHQRYYASIGVNAWLKQEVPFNLTSNARAAWQHAFLVFQTIASQDPSPSEPLHILETGGGLGLFALNFLEAFETLCQAKKRPYFQQIHYWLTDGAHKTLSELSQFEAFETYLADQTLGLYQLDILAPELKAHALDGEVLALADYPFIAIIGNYQYSPLPISVYVHQGEQWLEKQTELYYRLAPTEDKAAQTQILKELALRLSSMTLAQHLAPNHPQKMVFEALDHSIKTTAEFLLSSPELGTKDLKADLENHLTQAWMDALQLTPGSPAADLRLTVRDAIVDPLFDFKDIQLNQTEEESSYVEVNLAEQLSLFETNLLESLAQHFPQMTLPFPQAALSAIEKLLPLCQGIFLLSDKGHYSPTNMAGIQEVTPTLHGNSMAHAVNFPLLEMACQRKGYPVLRTFDETNALQTLLVYGQDELPDTVKKGFETHFIERNLNEESHANLEAGHLFMQQGQLDKALNYLLRALRVRQTDALLIYLISVCYLNLAQYETALNYLKRPHDDYFGILNFEVLRAEALRSLGQYESALTDYRQALDTFGEDSLVLYNMGLCYEELHNLPQALQAYQQAHELNPADQEIENTLSDLMKRI